MLWRGFANEGKGPRGVSEGKRVNTFFFEHAHRFSEQEYSELTALLSTRRVHRYSRRVAIFVVAVLCLFSAYTMLLGVALLLLMALAIWMPHTFKGTGARRHRESQLLGSTLTYGASERALWVHGPGYSAHAPWEFLGYWRIREDWLILPCEGIPIVYLSIPALRAAGVYDQVMGLVHAHGKPFDPPGSPAQG